MPVRKRILIPPALRPRYRLPKIVTHPAVRVIWQTLNARADLTVRGVSRKSGVDVRTIRRWRKGYGARVADVEAVLNACGLKLICVDNEQ